jgi:hypothetical protein
MGPGNQFQGINSASLCSLAGRYDNPIPPRFLAPINCLKIPAQVRQHQQTQQEHQGSNPSRNVCNSRSAFSLETIMLLLIKYILRNMCLAIMAPVSQLICAKEWRKSTNTFDAPIFLENKISHSLTAVCTRYYKSLHYKIFAQ